MLGKKFDHEAIKKPGLLDLTGMAGSGQDLQLAIGDARFEREGSLIGAVLTPGQDCRRAGARMSMSLVV